MTGTAQRFARLGVLRKPADTIVDLRNSAAIMLRRPDDAVAEHLGLAA